MTLEDKGIVVARTSGGRKNRIPYGRLDGAGHSGNCQKELCLPELALLATRLLSYVAATSEPVASGFWDQAARWVCGRTRRALARMHGRNLGHFAQLPCWGGQLRKKASVTAYLSTGVEAHRRHKPERGPSQVTQTADFTGN